MLLDDNCVIFSRFVMSYLQQKQPQIELSGHMYDLKQPSVPF